MILDVANDQTLEDVKIRTRTGAFCEFLILTLHNTQQNSVTFLSIGIISLLTLIEFIDYRSVYLDTAVEINKNRDERITAHFNITFPRVPCFCQSCSIVHTLCLIAYPRFTVLSLDVTDVSGEHLQEIAHNVLKTKLDPQGVPYPEAAVVSGRTLVFF